MRTFYMIRHGETDWNKEGRLQGHTDISLNDTGRDQAARVRDGIRYLRFDFCYTSDLCRARETAMIATNGHPDIGSGRLQSLSDLRERFYARMEGKTHAEVQEDQEQNPHLYYDENGKGKLFPHDGEKKDAFKARIQRVIGIVTDGDSEKKILFVTHGGVIRQIWRELVNPDHDHQPKNSTLYTMTQDGPDGKWTCFPMP